MGSSPKADGGYKKPSLAGKVRVVTKIGIKKRLKRSAGVVAAKSRNSSRPPISDAVGRSMPMDESGAAVLPVEEELMEAVQNSGDYE